MLGRSNSLSLNTSAVNSSFTNNLASARTDDPHYSQSDHQKREWAPDARVTSIADAPWMDPNWQPPPPPTVHLDAGSEWRQDSKNPRIFSTEMRKDLQGPGPRKKLTPRSAAQQNQNQGQTQTGGSSLFGSTQTSQPAQSGGVFGGAQTQSSQPAQSGSLFGGSLFSGNNNQNQQQNQQQQTSNTGGGLFGSQPAQNQGQQQQNTQSSGGGLFGGSLFGGNQQNQSTMNKPAGSSLFGGTNTQQSTGGGLFGGANQQNNSLFGTSANNQSGSNTLFGNLNQSSNQPPPPSAASQTSLLGASRYNQSQYQPFVTGRLTMGQGAAPQPTATPATKLDWSNVRPTTRFNDLTDQAREDIEKIEKLILEQEDLCRQIEAFLPNHGNDLQTLGPDVKVVTDKLTEVDESLTVDAQGVHHDKQLAQKDEKDIARCERTIDNLRMPAQYVYQPAANNGRGQAATWDETYDTDLINNYFLPMTGDMSRLLSNYSSNLAEIESHMGTIEQSTVLQAQQLSAQRSGLGGAMNMGNQSVKELAETLRGFEATILAAAGKVGECREGINELALGRFGASQGGRRW